LPECFAPSYRKAAKTAATAISFQIPVLGSLDKKGEEDSI
jgi:acetyl-CoA carboxylase alpha subunit